MAKIEEQIKVTFDTNADSAKKAIDRVAVSVDKADKTAEHLAKTFEDVYGELKPLTSRLGEAEDRLYELALAGDTTSKEYQGLLEVVAKYRKTQIETDKVVDAASTNLGQKLGGAAQIAATGVSGLTAGMAIFGAESEDTQKALLKVQAAMAFSDAISRMSELGGQWRVLKDGIANVTIVQKANNASVGAAAIVQNAFTGAVNLNSRAFKALKLAIAGTGIGLLVVGLATLVTNFDAVKTAIFKFIPGLEKAGQVIKGIVQGITDFIGVTSEVDRAMDKQKKNAEEYLKVNKNLLIREGHQMSEARKREIQLQNEHYERVIEGSISVMDSLNINESKRTQFKKEEADKQRVIDNALTIDRVNKAREEANRLKEIREAFNKTVSDKEESLLRQLQDLQDDSAQEKLDRQKLRDEAEIELLRKKGADVAVMLKLNAQIYAEKQADLDERAREEKKAKEQREDKAREDFLKQFEDNKELGFLKARNEAEIEEIRLHNEKLLQLKLDAKIAESDALGGTEAERLERKNLIEKEFQEKSLANKKIADAAILAAEKEKKDAQRSLEDKALGVAGILAGKNRTLQKSLVVGEGAVALGRLFSKSAQGDGAALALGITQAGPVAGPALAAPAITSNKINTALSAATIIASTKKALQALGGGGSISAGSTPTISAPAAVSAAPQVGFQSSSENQIATSIASNQSKQPPIKAFVVTSEVTEGQNQDAKLIAQNSFG